MKTPLLFSIPLLITVLASQAQGQAVASSFDVPAAATGTIPQVSSDPAVRQVDGSVSDKLEMTIRGQRRSVEVMSGQVFVRSRAGKEQLHKFTGGKGLAGLAAEEMRLKKLSKGADKLSLVAYPLDLPRTDDNMFLISAKVNVRLMQGVDHKTFYDATGAVKAKLMGFAPNSMILTFASAVEAMAAVERLSAMPGVISASQVIGVKRMPEYLPLDQYLFPVGPEYTPYPNWDNTIDWNCPRSGTLCEFHLANPTSAYTWWANNRVGLLRPTVRELGDGPVNGPASQVDLGDLPPIGYDPAFPKLQGEQADIRLLLAWENMITTVDRVSGFNQKILIIDDGVVSQHPDLRAALGAPQAVDLFSAHHKNMYTGLNSPEPEDPIFDSHGTGLAGLVAARRNNTDIAGTGGGIVGVAPRSTIQAVVGIQRFIDDDEWAEAFAYGTTLEDEDNDGLLWDQKRKGRMDCDIVLNASSEQGSASATRLFPEDYLWHQAITFGATEQRNLKGVVYITSAGNGAGGGGSGHMDVNYMEQKNSIYQIPVGGVSDLGRRIGRSNSGANLVCVAPTWGDELPPLFDWPDAPWPAGELRHLQDAIPPAPGQVSAFYLRPIRKNPPVGPDDLPSPWRRASQGIVTLGPTIKNATTNITTYTHNFDFTGTSASAAQVAGIVALMLEVNPSLTYRDIKEILMRSSRVVNDVRVNIRAAAGPVPDPRSLHPTQWRMSSLGRPLNHAFGAGLIDANRAIKIAKKWTSLGIEPRPLVPVDFDPTTPGYAKIITQRDRFTAGIYIPKPSSELIPTDGSWKEIIIPPPIANMRLDHIEVRLRLYHYRRGDLEIKLVAPQESNWDINMAEPMESVLFAPHRDDYQTSYYDGLDLLTGKPSSLNTPTDWTFTTVRHWGTRPGKGQWKLLIRDAVSQGSSTTPVFSPKGDSDSGDPAFRSRQKLDGIAMTYHGSFTSNPVNDPPTVTTEKLRFTLGNTPIITQLKATVGSGGVGGEAPFPVISWDMYDSSEICPVQPTNPTRAPFEFFPPGWRLAGDTSESPVLVPLTTVANNLPLIPVEWPQRQHPPTWISFFDPPPLNVPPLEIPPPLTPESEGAQGALSSRPPWVTDEKLTLNGNHIIFNSIRKPLTNTIHARLNRTNGKLEIIPLNPGKYTIPVYAENLLGLSKVRPLDITVVGAASSYTSWAGVFWTVPDLGDPCTSTVSGYLADPDGDGLSNILEYTLRMDPTVPNENPMSSYTVEGSDLVFRWQRDLLAGDVIQTAEISEDLTSWSTVTPTTIATTNNLEDLEYRLPLGPSARTYFRLKASPVVPCPPVGP